MSHQAVLLQEIIGSLRLTPGMTVVDGTFGGGNMSRAIAETIGPRGRLIAFDRDKTAFRGEVVSALGKLTRFVPIVGNFRTMDAELRCRRIKRIDGAIFDLGLSSDQLESSGRGFSFQRDEPLRMTFAAPPETANPLASSQETEITAELIVNHWSEDSIATILKGFGEERFARSIAMHIGQARKVGPIETTGQLVEVIHQAVPSWYRHGRIHFATRTFQALRIAVNDELGAIPEGLRSVALHLSNGGRLSVISFHSVEDRAVKRALRALEADRIVRAVVKKPIIPSQDEIKKNPRSRSAKLRIVEKL